MSKNLNYLILLWIFILSSCATITRGTKDTFVINSVFTATYFNIIYYKKVFFNTRFLKIKPRL